MKIAITGATGLIGKKIVEKLTDNKNEIIILSRSAEKSKQIFPGNVKTIKWNPYSVNEIISDAGQLENLDSIIHLAGENVMSKRWSDEQKKKIFDSRVKTTAALFQIISKLRNKPKSVVSASAVGFYDNKAENVCDEYSQSGNDFLAEVTSAWENEGRKFAEENIREVRIRIGIVLSKDGGALARLIPLYKYFIGGSIGSGKQWFPWIHIDDLANLFVAAVTNEKYIGAYNAVSPGITTMKEFSKTLGNLMSRPSIFTVPEFALKIVLGEAAEALIKGAKIIPKRTVETGFQFEYTELKSALKSLV